MAHDEHGNSGIPELLRRPQDQSHGQGPVIITETETDAAAGLAVRVLNLIYRLLV